MSTPRHALDAAINAVAAIEDNLSTSYSDAILTALAAEGWMFRDGLRPWLRHKDWCNVKTDDPPDTERCKCGLRAALASEPGLDVERLARAHRVERQGDMLVCSDCGASVFAPDPAPLDVERLARLIEAAIVDDESGMETFDAADIAREYAALEATP